MATSDDADLVAKGLKILREMATVKAAHISPVLKTRMLAQLERSLEALQGVSTPVVNDVADARRAEKRIA